MIELSEDFFIALERFSLSILLLLSILFLVYWQKLNLHKDLLFSSIRGFIQLMLLASIIFIVFSFENSVPLILILLIMILFASITIARRFEEIPDLTKMFFITLVITVNLVLFTSIIFGILPFTGEFFIPIGGMITANAMNITYLSVNRTLSEIHNRKNEIESALSLGLPPLEILRGLNIKSQSLINGITPTLNNLKTLGLVSIPGLMSGMIIAGVNPITAAFYQLIIFFLILLSGLIASIISSFLIIHKIFDKNTYILLISNKKHN